MQDELSARQAAIRMRLSGEKVDDICRTLCRSDAWFRKWWQRYLASGPEGLYDLTRANQHVVNRTPPHIERAIISIRKRLDKRSTPETRYCFVGAAQVRAELEKLGYSPIPCLRTIERIVARAGLTCPPLRLAPKLVQSDYPVPQAYDSNQLHQIDFVGPRYLKGDKTRYYFLICKDVFDQAVYIEFVEGHTSDIVLECLTHAWQFLGLPNIAQFDNGSEFSGRGPARNLSRVIRFCLRLRVEPMFIPPRQACYNGSVEQFNGWFQPLLLERPYQNTNEIRTEVQYLMTAVNEQNVHPHLGYRTPFQYRKGKRIRKLPADCQLYQEKKFPISVGKVHFIRLVTGKGNIGILEQKFKIGKQLKYKYVKATLYTQHQVLKIYHKGRLVKQFDYPLPLSKK